eukprot:CAMPEP_0117451546 /NCGR_PEP_ID=MMETSP0759-20121206/9068_1 /TAXON_ID=63605 /ORGANISM="Percolomonas cosmopolitus, Strain WS" /LENGTH=398 /DNA_ID=CAMNT_0005244159 /DNA_START=290 /DNA_END=1483 /DNA_ORIENTATION=+
MQQKARMPAKTSSEFSNQRDALMSFKNAKETLSHYQRNALKRHAWHLYVHKMRSQLVRQENVRISLNDQKSVEQFKVFRRRVLDYRRKKRILSINNILESEKYNDIVSMEKSRISRERRQRRLNQLSIEETRRIAGLKRMSVEAGTFVTPDNIDAHIARELNPSKLLINTVFEGVRGVNDEVEYDLRIEEHFMNEYKQFDGNSAREFRDPLYPDARIYPWAGPIDSSLDFVGPYEQLTAGQSARFKERRSDTLLDPFDIQSRMQQEEKDPLMSILYGDSDNEEPSSSSKEKVSRAQQMEEEDPHLGIYHEEVNTPEEFKKEFSQHYPFLEVHNKSIRRTKEVVEREELLGKYKERLEEADRAEAAAEMNERDSESWGGNALADNRDVEEDKDVSQMLD